jgi:hypothetical protein
MFGTCLPKTCLCVIGVHPNIIGKLHDDRKGKMSFFVFMRTSYAPHDNVPPHSALISIHSHTARGLGSRPNPRTWPKGCLSRAHETTIGLSLKAQFLSMCRRKISRIFAIIGKKRREMLLYSWGTERLATS